MSITTILFQGIHVIVRSVDIKASQKGCPLSEIAQDCSKIFSKCNGTTTHVQPVFSSKILRYKSQQNLVIVANVIID